MVAHGVSRGKNAIRESPGRVERQAYAHAPPDIREWKPLTGGAFVIVERRVNQEGRANQFNY